MRAQKSRWGDSLRRGAACWRSQLSVRTWIRRGQKLMAGCIRFNSTMHTFARILGARPSCDSLLIRRFAAVRCDVDEGEADQRHAVFDEQVDGEDLPDDIPGQDATKCTNGEDEVIDGHADAVG